jgi:predicted nucleic acid-binding protein
LILDTGPLVAALDRDDQNHQRCAELLATAPGPLRVPGPVLTEVCYPPSANADLAPRRALQPAAP